MTQTPDSSPLDASARKRPWRDNIEAMTMAIVMAVMLKYFVVEASSAVESGAEGSGVCVIRSYEDSHCQMS